MSNPFDFEVDEQNIVVELPLAVYCPGCGGYVLLIGERDFQCKCGCVFDVVLENGLVVIDVKRSHAAHSEDVA